MFRQSQPPESSGWSPKAAGLVSGLIAGLAYLGAQMAFSTLLGLDGALASLQRIAAILLGSDALPPGHVLGIELAMGLLIHLPLSAALGLLIGHWVRGCSAIAGAFLGAVAGAVFFVGVFFVLAPSAFPWFLDVRNPATAFDHVMFGGIAGSLSAMLQRSRGATAGGPRFSAPNRPS